MKLLPAILHLALPALSILAMGRPAARRGLAWTVVAGLALYESVLLCVGLLLGYAGLLRPPVPLLVWTVVSALLAVIAARGAGPIWRTARSAASGARVRPVGTIAIGAAAFMTAYLVGLQVARDWILGTADFDSLSYHIPRALLWTWHGGFAPWPAAVWQQVGLPLGGDVLLLPGVLLGLGWIGSGWTTAWLALGAAAAIFAATRGFGVGRRASLLAALVFLSFPAVGSRLIQVNSDIAAAFPLLAAWVLCARAESLPAAAFLFPALGGVAVASKANVAVAVFLLAAAFFASRLRALLASRKALLAAAAGTLVAALICIASYLPVYRLFGDLVGGTEGKSLVSFRMGPEAVAKATLFGTVHWLIEPFALVPEPPRFDWLDRLGIGRLYNALGAGTRERWYPWVDAATNQSGLFPLLALPWLLAALPKERRLRGGLLFLALLLAFFAPVRPNCFAARFTVVLLGAFAVLWGVRAARSPAVVSLLLLVGLSVDADRLQWNLRPEPASFRLPDRNAHVARRVGSGTLWLLTGPLSVDAQIAGKRADVRFEYLSCPPDRDWVRLFAQARRESPWLLLDVNVPQLGTGPQYYSKYGPPCPSVPVPELQSDLAAAGWRMDLEEEGYQVWTALP